MKDFRIDAAKDAARKTLIIAEIGENYLGDLKLAKLMVDAAAAAGADYAKFQSYRGQDFPDDNPEKEWFEMVTLTDDNHHILKEYCAEKGIKFMSAPATMERCKFLVESVGMKEIKLASNRLRDEEMLTYLAGCDLDRIFLSTGNGGMDEVRRALDLLAESKAEIVPLHCVSLYPTSHCEANLSAIPFMEKELGMPVGYSDHTIGNLACEIAVGLGACAIEKHFTLDKAMPGTDHVIAADTGDLCGLVQSIGFIEQMLGTPGKSPSVREEAELGG